MNFLLKLPDIGESLTVTTRPAEMDDSEVQTCDLS